MEKQPLDLAVSLTATAQEVLTGNPLRRSATFVNDSDTVCYLRLGQQAVANRGIRLNASGGSYEINLTNPWYGKVYAVSLGAAKILLVVEVSN